MRFFKKIGNLYRVLLILILVCSLLASCTEAPDGGDSDTPQNGAGDTAPPEGDTVPDEETSWKDKLLMVSNTSPGMASPIALRILGNTSEIHSESNLDIVFVYYLIGDLSVIIPTTDFTVECTVEMKCYDEENKKIEELEASVNVFDDYFIMNDNSYEENFDEYYFDGRTYRGRIDKITIPSNWFLCNKGAIVFTVSFDYTIPDNPEYEKELDVACGISLYYVKTGDTIKLFENQYYYNNYINQKGELL